jgi:CheY-like chemotaxis protein
MKPIKSKDALGTHEIAKLCQVTPPTVIRWMEEGKLLFFTTGGGHRRVWNVHLAAFLRGHNLPVPASLEAGKLKFLVVEDDAVFRRLLVRLIRSAYPDSEIAEAGDGFAAGHLVHACFPAVITLDLDLPGVDGFKICEMIRGDLKLRGIKILAVTGSNTEEAKARVLAAGADEFLGKPFGEEELVRKLGALLAGARGRGKGDL